MYGRRPGGNGVPGGPRGAQRSASGNGYSRQNAAPYSRPSTAQRAPSQSQSSDSSVATPPQVSIRGATYSIPTQVIVSNLAKGTTVEDLRQALLKCGDIIRVRERRAAATRNGMTFEVLFEDRPGALSAVREFNGAFADDHLLEAVIEEDPRPNVAVQQPKRENPPPPTGPRGDQDSNGYDNGRTGRPLAPKASNGSGAVTQKDRRGMSKLQQEQQQVPLPTGPRAITPITKSKAANVRAAKAAKAVRSLKSRLGGLPLAQRLGDVKGGSKSDLATLEANKSKKAAKRQAKVAAATAATTAATPSKSKIQREKKKAKIAALREKQQSAPSSDSAMQLD